MSPDGGQTWRWQESTASFGPRAGAAAVASEGLLLLSGGVHKGRVMNDVYRATLPHGNPDSDGGVVAGILGASAGLIVAFLALRLCLRHVRDQALRRRDKAERDLAAYAAASSNADSPDQMERGYTSPNEH